MGVQYAHRNTHGVLSVYFPDSGIGSHYLMDGDEELGFFGEIEAAKFIRGDSLSALAGVTAGRPHIIDAPWLKFIRKGKVIIVAKQPIRHSISWDDLYEKDCVYGNLVVSIRGYDYALRLLNGTNEDPAEWDNLASNAYYDEESTHGSEWNELLYPIHEYNPPSQTVDNYEASEFDLSSVIPPEAERLVYTRKTINEGELRYLEHYLSEQDLYRMLNSKWELYNNANLMVSANYGRNSWCQETWAYNDEYRIQRGCSGIDYVTVRKSWERSDSYGWRPALELIGKTGDES